MDNSTKESVLIFDFEFASASRDTESAFRYCRRYYNYIHTAIPNNKIHYQLTTDDI